MRLVLIRHGQTTSNVAGLLDTAVPGADLTDLGREQARALVGALSGMTIDALYVSDLVRTHQTAAPLALARGLEPQVRAGLREVQAGELEMRGDAESVRSYLSVLASWFRGDLEARMPGAETGEEVLTRFDEVVREAVDGAVDGASVALVSHGAVLRLWAASRCVNLDAPSLSRLELSNTGVIVVEGSPGSGWRAVTWEDDALGGPEVGADADGPTA